MAKSKSKKNRDIIRLLHKTKNKRQSLVLWNESACKLLNIYTLAYLDIKRGTYSIITLWEDTEKDAIWWNRKSEIISQTLCRAKCDEIESN